MNRFENNSIESLTGGMVESDILGYQDVGWDNNAYINSRKTGDNFVAKSLINHWCKMHHVDHRGDLRSNLIQYFIENPGWDPSDPIDEKGSKIPNDFHAMVADKVTENYGDLKFYRTNNSPLDTLFGIDAFFEFNGKIVTIDFTKNPHKTEHKADLVVPAADCYEEESLERVANDVASILLTEIIEVDPDSIPLQK